MEIGIDQAGRVELPKDVRERYGLGVGSELELIEQAEGILLRPVSAKPAMTQVDGWWVHHGEPVGGTDIVALLEREREERLGTILGRKP